MCVGGGGGGACSSDHVCVCVLWGVLSVHEYNDLALAVYMYVVSRENLAS